MRAVGANINPSTKRRVRITLRCHASSRIDSSIPPAKRRRHSSASRECCEVRPSPPCGAVCTYFSNLKMQDICPVSPDRRYLGRPILGPFLKSLGWSKCSTTPATVETWYEYANSLLLTEPLQTGGADRCAARRLDSHISAPVTVERKKELRNPLQKGVAEDIIGPCGV